jgi:hypothetical protein
MFNQGGAFAQTARDIYEKHFATSPYGMHAAAPFIVNAAFAVEIFLKTLHPNAGAKDGANWIKMPGRRKLRTLRA